MFSTRRLIIIVGLYTDTENMFTVVSLLKNFKNLKFDHGIDGLN